MEPLSEAMKYDVAITVLESMLAVNKRARNDELARVNANTEKLEWLTLRIAQLRKERHLLRHDNIKEINQILEEYAPIVKEGIEKIWCA